MYPLWFYYVAIVSNAVLRVSWALTISQQVGDVLKTCIACAEIFRRSMWNLLRLENEHLNNVGNYRATNYHERITQRLRNSGNEDEMLFLEGVPGDSSAQNSIVVVAEEPATGVTVNLGGSQSELEATGERETR